MKNYHLDLVRVTESGAISAAKWVGRGDKLEADRAATRAMQDRLNEIDFAAEIAIGEGKKDESYGLYEGEKVGANRFDEYEGFRFDYSIAIDPIEGTTPVVNGGYEAVSVIAMAEKNALYKTNHFYMDKIAVGHKAYEAVNLDSSPMSNVSMLAEYLDKRISDITVCVIDRPRTADLIRKLRDVGCRIKFISDCDVTACIAACIPNSGIDMYWSIGGAPEAIIAAAAMKCMGGFLQCREYDRVQLLGGFDFANPEPQYSFEPAGGELLQIEDLAAGEVMFAATGITDGSLLKGVRFSSNGPITNSVTMRSESGTVRWLTTEHGND